MTRSKFRNRRAPVLLAGLAVAASASLLMSGCGSGQTSSTADTVPAVDGLNADLAANNGQGDYSVRNMTVDFKVEGYPAGSDARLSLSLYNDTGEPVTVKVSSPGAQAVRLVDPNATPSPVPAEPTEAPSPGASETPTPSAAPATEAPVGGPAEITIPPAGFVQLNQEQGSFLLLTGLNKGLNAGDSVPVVFDFGGQQLTTQAGLAVPLSPVPRGPKVVPDEGDEADIAPFGG
ncbi:hypothetical protein DFJ67_2621 [Asanoa ferruginea]|uniref:Copper(I)-binding protein n=1 Tax=Asanoa ferruginea TaxID=53367 RepID=A0A3D9ZJI1_9ACTN|nr:hypothetical protein [Asanoa ferruginea]REF96632.1 hypothetical protein DFJ67_2621 [Asanoa ferruginea]GIF48984.1 hypothetical protein Afe04nite_35230 [Asanoa ferruginea]